MNELLMLLPAFAAGVLLGATFFGGLWWTVVRGVSSRQPSLWFLASMLVRTAVTVAGFYFVGREHWERWLVCLMGFVLTRLVMTRLARAPVERQKHPAPDNSYAP